MGVRTLAGPVRQLQFRSSRPKLQGYVALHGPAYGLRGEVFRRLGDGAVCGGPDSFCAGTPLDPSTTAGDGAYSVGTMPEGYPVGYSPFGDLGYTVPQPAAPVAPSGAAGSGGPSGQTPFSFVPPQANATPGSAVGSPTLPAGSTGGGTFPLWLGIAALAAAALILPPLIKKL